MNEKLEEYLVCGAIIACVFFYLWAIVACVMDNRTAMLIIDLIFIPVGVVHGFVDFIMVIFG